ncbi:MAG: SpoIIE family protein phosphatase [Opitutae bacterium]|nr:SpoIIE family protein phosphatase [Opitutae bacterium]
MKTPNSTIRVDWAVAQSALPGQAVSGDLHLVQSHDRGLLLAVVDGIGHGPEATRAATAATESLRQYPNDSLHSLINRCHITLGPTRGVVMSLAKFDEHDHTVTWCGIGNVEALLLRGDGANGAANERALQKGGTVGAQLPVIYASVIPVYAGDVLIFASDGIRPDFEHDVPVKSAPQRIADHLLQKYSKGTDDALVLVARFKEANHER